MVNPRCIRKVKEKWTVKSNITTILCPFRLELWLLPYIGGMPGFPQMTKRAVQIIFAARPASSLMPTFEVQRRHFLFWNRALNEVPQSAQAAMVSKVNVTYMNSPKNEGAYHFQPHLHSMTAHDCTNSFSRAM